MPLYHTLAVCAITCDLDHVTVLVSYGTHLDLAHVAMWTLLHVTSSEHEMQESNPRQRGWKPLCYLYTNLAPVFYIMDACL